jgi:pyridinium-3,5-biscarboxylic acid mononucleotide sulfurtransferase
VNGSDAARLLAWFRRVPHVTVAFSGGVDSALVVAAAARSLGPGNVVAVTAESPSLPSGMLESARQLAADLNVEHTIVRTAEMQVAGYRANGGDRCYFCKATLVDTISAIESLARWPLVTGTNADDVRAGWRPGIRAAAERGAGTPLADTGLAKEQVRAISRAWQLPTWDRPASPCLSSRIAYGIEITPARLARVDRAEVAVAAALASAGIDVVDLRVRDLGEAVRLEVDAERVVEVRQAHGVREAIATAGFDSAAVEVGPFRSGSMNSVLPPQLQFG